MNNRTGFGLWEFSTKERNGPPVLICRSTNCKHKAHQFIQLKYEETTYGPIKDKIIIGYCKKHAKDDRYITKRWSNALGWTFEKFVDRAELLVDEVMRS